VAELIFFLIAAGTIVFAFLTVNSRDIFHSAVWLSMTLLNIAGIYFFLGAEFVGVIQVLVYIGGIITLFVFAIKLTAQIGEKTIVQVNRQVIPAILVCIAFLFSLVSVIRSYPWAATQPTAEAISLKQIGQSLMTVYVLPFEFMSLILLGAMIGAIIIGKVKR